MTDKKEDPRTENLYGLDPTDTDYFYRLCGGDEESVKVALTLFNSQRAVTTGKNYSHVIRDLKEFCVETGSSYDLLEAKTIAQFVVRTYVKQKGKSYLAYIRPAIRTIEESRGIPAEQSVCNNVTIAAMIAGAKRRAAETAPPISKVDELPIDALKDGFKTYVWGQPVDKIDFVILRTLYRWLVAAYTMVRYEGIRHVKAKHVKIVTDSKGQRAVQIYIEKEKNDQLHLGQFRVMPEAPGEIIEPVTLTLIYFKRAGFEIGKGEEYVWCRTQGRKADGRYPLAYPTTLKDGKKLVKDLGYDIRYGENSSRRLGATNAFRNNVPMDKIAAIGGWKTKGIVEHYLSNTVDSKVAQAKALNFK